MYQLIFMDISMPIMDGYQSTLAIREFEKAYSIGNPVYIVGLSAHSTGVYKKKSFAVGMNDFSKVKFLNSYSDETY